MYKISMIGNLVKDPNFTVTPNGKSVADISICCDTGRDSKIFEDITFWDKDAEIAAKFLTKGREIYVEADVRDDSWIDNNGVKINKKKLICRNFKFIGRKND